MAKPKKAEKKNAAVLDDEPIVKAQADDNDDGDDNEEEDAEDDNEAGDDEEDEDDKKSDLSESDLVKALDALEATGKAITGGATPREAALATKLANGESLTKAESEEFRALLTAKSEPEVPHKEQMMKSEQVANGFEASDFLDAIGTKLGEALDGITTRMAKSQDDADEFNAQLAKSFVALGRQVIGLQTQVSKLQKALGEAQEQPAHAPKGSARVTERFRAPDENSVQLTKSQILDDMEEMFMKGEGPENVDLSVEIAKFESTGAVVPSVMQKIFSKHGIKAKDKSAA